MIHESIPCGVVVVGCGTVGGATAQILYRDKELLQTRSGLPLYLKYVVDINFSYAEKLGLPKHLYTSDLDIVLNDPEIGIVVELIGGTTVAKQCIEKALKAGKYVVTANKALLAHHGVELFRLAREKGKAIAFEASCGGGIPIIRALYDGLLANRIDALYGIVNGTCNYILTAMIQKGQSYDEALKEAQRDGLAEADPTLDVSGMDSAHKIAILSSLAFGKKVDLDSIPVSGIDTLQILDVGFGLELGYIVKLLAVAERREGGFSIRVRPSFISKQHPLAWVSGSFNAISVYGHANGHTMYYGRGAGGSPTASAVVADIISTAHGVSGKLFHALGIWPDRAENAILLPSGEIRSRYYLRTMVIDRPGVLGSISSILGKHKISISSFLQKELPEDSPEENVLPIVITTHRAQEGALNKALEEVNALDSVKKPCVCINILDEHPESL